MKRRLILVLTVIAVSFFNIQCIQPGDSGAENDDDNMVPAISLAKTGQTDSFEAEDDGDLQMGLIWPSPRFTVNGDNTAVTDKLTGLIWELSPVTAVMTWQDALIYANDLILDDCTDWRLPNINELESLCSSREALQGTWLRSIAFSDSVQDSNYWTSTTDASLTDNAWYVDTSSSRLNTSRKTNATCHVWAVRGESSILIKTGQTVSYAAGDDGDLETGAAWYSPRFLDQGAVIYDKMTGLSWQKTVDTSSRSWTDSFTYARGLNYDSSEDWRIPNKRELRSIINYGESSQTEYLASLGFSNFDKEYFWTSTIYAQNTSSVFACNFTGNLFAELPGAFVYHARTSEAYTVVVKGGE